MASAPLSPDDDRPPQRPLPPDVGSAYMRPDGTIEMRLRTETDDGTVGESLLVIAPDDERYADMLKHLGGLEPGGGKPIKPFPAPEA